VKSGNMQICTECGDKFTGEQIREMLAEHEDFWVRPFICPDCWDRIQHAGPEETVKRLLQD